jgi:predicted dehydrogenase
MTDSLDRRSFLTHTVAGLGALTAGSLLAADPEPAAKRVKVGVIGCGSVSRFYFPHLKASPYAELVSACDVVVDRATSWAQKVDVPNVYSNVQDMLKGAKFDLFVNLTDMQEHEELNRLAIEAGKHVWSEKPIANTLGGGQKLMDLAKQKGVRIWGAPTAVQSPQFAYMSKQIQAGRLGRIAVGHGSYGHGGPDWSSFFYEKFGGSLPDLGVYNLTSLTGLLGPAKSVMGMTSIVNPTRHIHGKGDVPVVAEDNAVVIVEHANGVLSHVECGFNYFTPHEHSGGDQDHRTIMITGSQGVLCLMGYDWAPHAVQESYISQPSMQRVATDRGNYKYENGASLVAECLATGKEPLFTPEHSLHVVEIMNAAVKSQETGQRIKIESTFKWPIVA